MTNLFTKIEYALEQAKQGWCSLEKAKTLAAVVIALRPELSLEIGVWGGRSLLPIALAHKELGRGYVIGIDPWSAAASAAGQMGPDLEWWGKVAPHEAVYRDFIEKVALLGVRDCVKVMRKKSDDVTPPDRIDFFHLDGNHGAQAYKDAQRFGPRVRVGGLAFLDDLEWVGGNVGRAVEHMKELGFEELYRIDTGMMLQRVK